MSELTAEQRALLDKLRTGLDKLPDDLLDRGRHEAIADEIQTNIDRENIAANSATSDPDEPES